LGAVASVVAGFPAPFTPLGALAMATLPLLWLMFRRSRRMKAFAVQLPDALELTARALRAGHSLASGFNLVREEMAAPIGKEFGRVFEEQNLGVSMDDSLSGLTRRVPNLDLKFFATAIVLQKQTGGDLAEILDKIGYIIRERFKIWGQVQALTGEGRLSGIVLLALPPVLFLAVYRLNPDYVMMLFTDPMGKKMLAGAVVMQVLGALVIRKIINIKV
jgi:tight adherence protein B